MKFIFLFFTSLLFSFCLFAQNELNLKGGVIKNSGYSIYAIEAESGRVIYDTPQISLVPASVMKVITSAAALEILGSDFKFHTQFGIQGHINPINGILEGDLVVKGGCDPAFYSTYFDDHYKGTFEAWGEALVKAGIKKIQGNCIVDLSMMDRPSVPGGWLWEDIGNYYGAGVSALTYSDNNYNIHFSSSSQSGETVVIRGVDPEIPGLQLDNRVVSSTVNRDQAFIYGAPGSLSQLAEGSIPMGRSDFVVKAAMPDPSSAAINRLLEVIRQYHIELTGTTICRRLPNSGGFSLLADKSSPALGELICQLNQESINLFAEHLLREIGRASKHSTSPDSCAVALFDFWRGKGISVDGFYPTDGSGLSRSNAICPKTLAEVIRYMYLSPNRSVFFHSLPLAGRSGTLINSFKGTKLENQLQAKTGSMTRVRSLAGIFTNQQGKKIIFAIILNNFAGTQSMAGATIENFLQELYMYQQRK